MIVGVIGKEWRVGNGGEGWGGKEEEWKERGFDEGGVRMRVVKM